MRNAITCILFGGEGNSKNPDIQKEKAGKRGCFPIAHKRRVGAVPG